MTLENIQTQIPITSNTGSILSNFKRKIYKDISVPKISSSKLRDIQNYLNNLFVTSL